MPDLSPYELARHLRATSGKQAPRIPLPFTIAFHEMPRSFGPLMAIQIHGWNPVTSTSTGPPLWVSDAPDSGTWIFRCYRCFFGWTKQTWILLKASENIRKHGFHVGHPSNLPLTVTHCKPPWGCVWPIFFFRIPSCGFGRFWCGIRGALLKIPGMTPSCLPETCGRNAFLPLSYGSWQHFECQNRRHPRRMGKVQHKTQSQYDLMWLNLPELLQVLYINPIFW